MESTPTPTDKVSIVLFSGTTAQLLALGPQVRWHADDCVLLDGHDPMRARDFLPLAGQVSERVRSEAWMRSGVLALCAVVIGALFI